MPGRPVPLARGEPVFSDSMARDYVEAIVRQVGRLEGRFDTVYIGGGTPTALDAGELERLLRALGKNISEDTEFTVEANPESLDAVKLKMLPGLGVNRLSIGLQSLDDRKLKRLGRIHNAAKGADAVAMAAKAGFANISADLIFGVWDETPEGWAGELESVSRLPLAHISAYSLTYEKKTPLFAALRNKSVSPIDDGLVAAMYEAAIDRLALRGFKQYEVSSFAKEARECRHNISYWQNNPYIGLGASAVSYIDGVRSKNVSDVREYIKRCESGASLAESEEKLSPVRRAKETAAVKIRTREGIGFDWFRAKTGYDFLKLESKAVEPLVADGLLKYVRSGDSVTGVALKHKGFLFCDTVSSALL